MSPVYLLDKTTRQGRSGKGTPKPDGLPVDPLRVHTEKEGTYNPIEHDLQLFTTEAQRHREFFNFLSHILAEDRCSNSVTLRDLIPQELNQLSGKVVEAAFAVHSRLGPGLLESVYQRCLAHELKKRDILFEQEVFLPIHYDGLRLDAGLRIDLWINRRVIVELKSVENLLRVHQAQMLTYLKLTGNRLGLLINFNVPVIRNGIRRIVL